MSIGGRVIPYPGAAVTVTLTSDAGVETTVSDGSGEFQFKSVAPGPYELFAQAAADRRYRGGTVAGYQYITVDHDRSDYRLNLAPLPELQVQLEDIKGQPIDARTVQILARRKDLSGDQPPANLRLGPSGVQLLPGRWDLMLSSIPGYYVASFTGPGIDPSERGRPEGWNEILLASGTAAVKFVLSPKPGRDPWRCHRKWLASRRSTGLPRSLRPAIAQAPHRPPHRPCRHEGAIPVLIWSDLSSPSGFEGF